MAASIRLSVTSCRTDRELTNPRRRTSHQQVGDVAAADEEHEADDTEEQQRRVAQLGADHGLV
jgi:hypothetical protein